METSNGAEQIAKNLYQNKSEVESAKILYKSFKEQGLTPAAVEFIAMVGKAMGEINYLYALKTGLILRSMMDGVWKEENVDS